MPTGSGKTVVGIKAIAERSVNTLILVNNKNLLAQWKEILNEFLAISDEPPLYYTPTGRERTTGRERRCPVIGEYSGAKKQSAGLVVPDYLLIQAIENGRRLGLLTRDDETLLTLKLQERNERFLKAR